MRYGLPYKGSKNKLAEKIIDILPPAKHLYDLFAGGCAITHCALLSRKWECVHFSDTNDAVVLFKDCLEGNVPDGSQWISREEFEKRKDSDPYIRLVWSFGNNQVDYLYSRQIEPYKKAVHEMIFAPTPIERRLKFREVCKLMELVIGSRYADHSSTERSQRLLADFLKETRYRLQSDERRVSIGELGKPFPGGYEMKVADYRGIEILPDSVIYCDIPYINTKRYIGAKFNYEDFYKWACRQVQPLFISEYWMPEDRFECVADFQHTSPFSSINNKTIRRIEKIYRPKCQIS